MLPRLMHRGPGTILLAEDNAADVRLFQLTCGEDFRGWSIDVVRDGEEALDYLYSRGPYAGKPCPNLLILDLNMPRRNGWDVLAEIKRHEKLRMLPVVVFSSTKATEHIRRVYDFGAACYVRKPDDLGGYETICRRMAEFWSHTATLPCASPS